MAGVGPLKRSGKEALHVAGAGEETSLSNMLGGQGADFLTGCVLESMHPTSMHPRTHASMHTSGRPCDDVHIQTYRHTNTDGYKHTHIHFYQHRRAYTYRHRNIETYRHTGIQTYRHTNLQRYKSNKGLTVNTWSL